MFTLPLLRIRCQRITAMLALSCALPFLAAAQPIITFNPVVTAGLSSPVDVVNAGDGTNRLFIAERGGSIKIVSGGVLTGKVLLNIADTIVSGGEQGLLSIAFHPDYENNRYFFVYYTRSSDSAVTVARFRTSANNPDSADPHSGVVLLAITKPNRQTNHNGGKLVFGNDGYLYFATGDGGGGGDPFNNAQDSTTLRGKMLRIDVNNFNAPPFYSIPPDNPFVSNPNVRPEIWALGLRNPFRWSFDRLNGNMWIADVGQGTWEEVNVRTFDQSDSINYGWRCYEGNATFNTAGCLPPSNYVFPIFVYGHDASGGFAVIGGYVYRGPDYPSIYGNYVMADNSTGNVWTIRPNASTGGWIVSAQTGPTGISGFGEAENGALYAVALSGTLYQLQGPPGGALPVRLVNFQGQLQNDAVHLTWTTSYEQGLKRFDVEASEKGDVFTTVGSLPADNVATGGTYTFDHRAITFQTMLYRLKIINTDGSVDYSNIITITNGGLLPTGIYPTVITNGILNVTLRESYHSLVIVGADGRMVLQRTIHGQTGNTTVQLPRLVPGTYLVQLIDTDRRWQQKIIVR